MPTDSALQLVVFSLGDEEYALPITHVQEIIRYQEPRSVASDTAWVRGVISLRGRIVPVYDLAARLGLDAGAAGAGKIVIVELGDEQAGIMVGDVDEVLTLSEGDLDAVPAGGADCLRAIAKVGDRLVVLLDPARIVAGTDAAVSTAAPRDAVAEAA
jgi:purine-binding chemotaxis protein CheW